jgi:hypothetical protein
MNIYIEWGFRSNPFETLPLPANQKGSKLMVGRETASRKIRKGLESSNKFVTVEGLNGVGKTSVINVSVFDAASQQIESSSGPLFIPCRKTFQLSSERKADDFKFEVLAEIGQTLIEAKDTLPIPKGYVKSPTNRALNRWLNSIDQKSGGFSTPLGGLNLGSGVTNSEGFNRSGLEKAVKDWLRLVFPSSNEGGVVCIIDNLELLQTSKSAREQIEALRDQVLSLEGVRWVLCGALGIIEGVAASPRMAGYLQRPITIGDLGKAHAGEIYRRRIDFFRREKSASVPINEQDFITLFEMYRGNLRAVLSECDSYCMHVSDLEDDQQTIGPDTFKNWLHSQVDEAYRTSVDFLGKRAFEVFEVACEKEAFSPSDHAEFGYESMQAMRPQIQALETAGLLVSTQDEADKRRRTVQVVPKGWKVQYYLRNIQKS